MARKPTDPRKAAEEVFRPAQTRMPEFDPKRPTLPEAKELISLRIDREVLDHFQSGGPGWQDRINQALRKAIGR